VVSATVITRPASEELAHIHDRQPLMLRREAWDAWLDPAVGADEAAKLLEAPAPDIVATPVSSAVGSVANNSPALIEEVPLEPDDVDTA
jgi:putative SOS response-associated peptidase YedK